jgi:hypothetical protein
MGSGLPSSTSFFVLVQSSTAKVRAASVAVPDGMAIATYKSPPLRRFHDIENPPNITTPTTADTPLVVPKFIIPVESQRRPNALKVRPEIIDADLPSEGNITEDEEMVSPDARRQKHVSCGAIHIHSSYPNHSSYKSTHCVCFCCSVGSSEDAGEAKKQGKLEG